MTLFGKTRRTAALLAALLALGPGLAAGETVNRTLKGNRLPVHQPERFGGHIEEWDERANPGRIGVSDFDPPVRRPRREEVPVARPVGGECAGASRMVCDVLVATNRERERHGLRRFRVDPACQRAADDHARDMARRGFFSHTSPSGSTLSSRYERYGRSMRLAENIAMGTHMDGTEAVRSWMNSPGHRRNILDSQLGAIGIGVAEGGGYRYFVQCFSQ